MQLILDLGKALLWKSSPVSLGLAVRHILQSSLLVNLRLLEINRMMHRKSGGKVPLIPPLYRSGVVYQAEPQSWEREHFDTIPVVLGRRWGDCDDLAPWRAAELRFSGEDPKADIVVKWKTMESGRKLYHVLVRRYSLSKVDGHYTYRYQGRVLEDPSRVLGMGRDPKVLAAHAGL